MTSPPDENPPEKTRPADANRHPRLDELIATLERLRAPGGCAWDREQTHESLVRYLIEETHELVDAIESRGRSELIEELGDVLYQVIFHADIAAHHADERERFDIEDVAAHMTAKMVGRHPHVFADASAATPAEVVALWDTVKATEKSSRTSVLDGIPLGMPSLLLAEKILGRSEKVGVAVGAEKLSATTTSAGGVATSGVDEHEIAAAEVRLGAELLAIVANARASGLDAERALRGALRSLQRDIREAETAAAGTSDSAVER